MPDLSLFTQLCDLLGITLNELLLGEFISNDSLKEKSNQVLYDVVASWLGKDKWEMKNITEVSTVLSLKNDVITVSYGNMCFRDIVLFYRYNIRCANILCVLLYTVAARSV